jgi:RNA polymerase sigma-70 factor (ECF subfamily)
MKKTMRPTGTRTDGQLIAIFNGGDERALAELMERWRRRLHSFVYQHGGGNDEQVFDIVQDTFIRVAKHAHKFKPGRRFSTWMFTIAINLTRNAVRNRQRKPKLILMSDLREDLDLMEIFADPKADACSLLDEHEVSNKLVESLAQMSPEQRESFQLREFQGLRYERIGELTRTNLGTVKSRLYRARENFESIYKSKMN